MILPRRSRFIFVILATMGAWLCLLYRATYSVYMRGGEPRAVHRVATTAEEKPVEEFLRESSPDRRERLAWLRQACQHLGFPPPPDVAKDNKAYRSVMRSSLRYLLVDDKHKVLMCAIPKVGCSNWKRLLLMETGAVNTSDPDTLDHYKLYAAEDRHIKRLEQYSESEARYRLANYFKFIFVRHPFERILSTYRDKFEDIRPWIQSYLVNHGREIIANFRKNATERSLQYGDDVTFSEFIQYVVTMNVNNIHWSKYEQRCHVCAIQYDFIGKMETLRPDADYMTDTLGMTHRYPQTETRNASAQTSDRLAAYYSRVPRDVVRNLKAYYFRDMYLFNYSDPPALVQLFGDLGNSRYLAGHPEK